LVQTRVTGQLPQNGLGLRRSQRSRERFGHFVLRSIPGQAFSIAGHDDAPAIPGFLNIEHQWIPESTAATLSPDGCGRRCPWRTLSTDLSQMNIKWEYGFDTWNRLYTSAEPQSTLFRLGDFSSAFGGFQGKSPAQTPKSSEKNGIRGVKRTGSRH
jgi:hypothetical protein